MDAVETSEKQAERSRQRDSIFLAGVVWFGANAERHNVRIRNISSGGMMVDFPQSRIKGSPVFAAIKNVGEVSGRVAWYQDGRMGIVFDNEIDADAARVKPAAAPSVPVYAPPVIQQRRPGLAIR